ncbi:hypothetical protein D3C72_1861460 [compost metagenome]
MQRRTACTNSSSDSLASTVAVPARGSAASEVAKASADASHADSSPLPSPTLNSRGSDVSKGLPMVSSNPRKPHTMRVVSPPPP